MSHLNAEQALQLVRRLANDSDFHKRFQKSPQDALQEMGLPSAFAACCSGINLPDANTLQRSEAALVSDLSSRTSQTVIGLNAK